MGYHSVSKSTGGGLLSAKWAVRYRPNIAAMEDHVARYSAGYQLGLQFHDFRLHYICVSSEAGWSSRELSARSRDGHLSQRYHDRRGSQLLVEPVAL